MLDNLLLGLQTVLAFPAILYMLGGVAGGLIAGALPGFTATMGMVVLLPITFGLPPIEGMLLLIGIYVGGIAGGLLPAIALNIPGTPASAATSLDGYPLFKQGRAQEAISAGFAASFVGGTVAAIMLMTLAPQLARFAIKFGAPEYFALGVLGLTLVISVSGSSVLKGLIAGLVGAFLATVGADPILGLPRFDGGYPALAGGISYVPALIGLFGFNEVLNAVLNPSSQVMTSTRERLRGLALLPIATLRRILPPSLRSGVIGALVGAIPGAGADIAAFLSYDIERRFSKDPSKYGKGEIRGVAASEAGNNADCGGAMIPMLTFGIPGDAQTAVLIAALMLQGLQPGPLLFTEHPHIVWSIFAGLLVSQFLMMLIGMVIAPLAIRLVMQPAWLLFPIVTVLCVVGAFALNNSVFDVWLMILFGVVGYLMRRFGVPVTPLVLAMILVPMVESELRRALIIYQGNFAAFFGRPIFTVIIGLAILSLLSAFYIQYRAQRKAAE